jgi:hypothetical protein
MTNPNTSTMWIAHDDPERPLTFGAWLCDCAACAIALEASARRDPALRVVIKRSCGRDIVTPADLLTRGADAWCADAGDYVREVFVAKSA